MRRVFLLLFFGTNLCSIGQNVVMNVVEPTEHTETIGQNNPPRSTIYIPSVYQDDHTLSFERCCFGSEIEIVQDGNVVYSSFITNEDGSVELPLSLIGECNLYLRWAGLLFEGVFILP